MKNSLKKLRVVFMGTPAFAVPTLEALMRECEVVAVLTQPDRPAGRGKKLAFSPVKEAAVGLGANGVDGEAAAFKILQPETLFIKKGSNAASSDPPANSPHAVRTYLKSLNADVFVVAAYGLILPKAIYTMPALGCINVHASLLPKYRGSSPIHAAILNGDKETGVTIMHISEGIDTGDMILTRQMPVQDDEYFPSVVERMANLGAEALIDALQMLAAGTAPRTPQDHTRATHAPMIAKTDGIINWNTPTAQIINKIRAFEPWPSAYTFYDNQPLKIWRAKAATPAGTSTAGAPLENAPPENQSPGTVLSSDKNGLLVKTADGALLATELQATKRMPAADFLRGRQINVGVVLG